MRMLTLLFCAALAAVTPIHAATMDAPNGWEGQAGTVRGVVQSQLPGQLKIDGKVLQFAPGSAQVFDRSGKQLRTVSLAPGTRVVYTLAEGSGRISYLWIL